MRRHENEQAIFGLRVPRNGLLVEDEIAIGYPRPAPFCAQRATPRSSKEEQF
jgi:hypothetical protein